MVDVGHLVFDLKTEDGRQGLDKFKYAIEQGLEASFSPAECNFEPAIIMPWPGIEFIDGAITIKPKVPELKVPVRLISTYNHEIAKLEFAYLSILRMGTCVTELLISGGHLAGEIKLRVNHEVSRPTEVLSGNFALLLDLSSVQVSYALSTVAFLTLLREDSVFKIELLESGKLLSCNINNSGISIDYLKQTRKILNDLAVVNQEFNLSLRFPNGNGIADDEVLHLSRIARGISGEIVRERQGGMVTGRVLKAKVIETYDELRK